MPNDSTAPELRRDTDDVSIIEAPDLRVAVGLIHADLQSIKAVQHEQAKTLQQVRELLQMFNNTKGFAKGLGVIAKIAMWCSLFAGGIGAVWLAWKQK